MNTGRKIFLIAALFTTAINFTACKKADVPAGDKVGQLQAPSTEIYTLENGLKVVLFNTHEGDWASVRVRVNTGFMQEADDRSQNGIAHHLEHMLFDGSKLNPEHDSFDKAIGGLGGSSNASTWFDETQYYITVPRQNLEKAMPFFADMFINPTFPDDDILKEVKAVQNEGSQRRNSDFIRLYEDIFHVSGHPNLEGYFFGSDKDLSRYKHADFVRFFNEHYDARNMVLTISGNLDDVKTKDVVATNFNAVTQKKEFIPTAEEKLFTARKPFQILEQKTANSLPMGLVLIPLPKYTDPLYYAAEQMVGSLLAPDRREFLKNKLIEKGWVDEAEIGTESFTSNDALYVIYNLTPDGQKNFESVLDATFAYFRKIDDLQISDAWLKQKQTALTVSEKLAQDDSLGYATTVAWRVAKLGITSPEDYLARRAAVTADQIHAVAKQYLVPDRMYVALGTPDQSVGSIDPETGRLVQITDKSAWLDELKVPRSDLFIASKLATENPLLASVRLQPFVGNLGEPLDQTSAVARVVAQERHDRPKAVTEANFFLANDSSAADSVALQTLLYAYELQNKDRFADIAESGRGLVLDYDDTVGVLSVGATGLSYGQADLVRDAVSDLLNQPVADEFVREAVKKSQFAERAGRTEREVSQALGVARSLVRKRGALLPGQRETLLGAIDPEALRARQKNLLADSHLLIGGYGDLLTKDLTGLAGRLAGLVKLSKPEIPVGLAMRHLPENYSQTYSFFINSDRSGLVWAYSGPRFEKQPTPEQLKELVAYAAMTSYLDKQVYNTVRTAKGLAYTANVRTNPLLKATYRDFSLLVFAGTSARDQGHKKLELAFDEVLQNIHKSIKPEDFAAAKGELVANLRAEPADYTERLSNLQAEVLNYGHFGAAKDLIAAAESLKEEDIAKAFDAYVWQKPHLDVMAFGQGDSLEPGTQLIFSLDDLPE